MFVWKYSVSGRRVGYRLMTSGGKIWRIARKEEGNADRSIFWSRNDIFPLLQYFFIYSYRTLFVFIFLPYLHSLYNYFFFAFSLFIFFLSFLSFFYCIFPLFLFPFNIFSPDDIGSYSPRGRIVLGKILKTPLISVPYAYHRGSEKGVCRKAIATYTVTVTVYKQSLAKIILTTHIQATT
jgi:hypothetical protein